MLKNAYFVGDLARLHGIQPWQVRRAIQRAVANGVMAEPARVGISRVFMDCQLPIVEAALRDAGYLASPHPEPVAG